MRTYRKKYKNNSIQIFLIIALVMSSMMMALHDGKVHATSEAFAPLGNRIENPTLQYSATDTQIQGWSIQATNNVSGGARVSSIQIPVVNGFRNLSSISGNAYGVGPSNLEGGPMRLRSLVTAQNSGAGPEASFMLLSQTTKLEANKKYFFRAELRGVGGSTSYGSLNIYPGTDVGGAHALATRSYTAGSKAEIFELEFTPRGTGQVTISIRLVKNADATAELNIYRMGFYLEDDYLIQKDLATLFSDSALTKLKKTSLDQIKAKIDSLRSKVVPSNTLYAQDVKKHVNDLLDKAQAMYDEIVGLNRDITNFYTDSTKTDTKATLKQTDIDALRERVDQVKSNEFNRDLNEQIDQLEVRYIITSNRPGVVQRIENDAQAAIDTINGLTTLTPEEKLQKIQEINAAKSAAISKVNDATTSQVLDTAITDANLAFDKIVAKQILNEKRNELHKRIDTLVNVTSADKATAKAAIDAILATQSNHIDAATSASGVKSSKDLGLAQMQDAYTKIRLSDNQNLDNAKAAAVANLNEKARIDKAAIDAMVALTQTQKDNLKANIDQIVNDATNHIQSLTSLSDVTDLVINTVTGMDEIMVQADLQNSIGDAIKRLEAKADEVNDRIGKIADLTQNELDSARVAVAETLRVSIETVRASHSRDAVTLNLNQGKDNLEAIYTNYKAIGDERLATNKANTLASLREKRDAALVHINGLSNLTQDQKGAFEAQIQAEYAAGELAINSATSREAMQTVLNYKANQFDITKHDASLQDSKNEAVETLNGKAQTLTQAINALLNVSDETKREAIAEINTVLTGAITDVKGASTVGGAYNEHTEGINQMQEIYETIEGIDKTLLNVAKSQRSNDLTLKADAAIAAFSTMTGLDDDQINRYINEIYASLNQGMADINTAASVKAANTHENNAANLIAETTKNAQLKNDQQNAITILNQKAEEVKNRLNRKPGVIADTITQAMQEITTITQAASQAINTATGAQSIQTKLEEAILSLENVAVEARLAGQINLQNARDAIINDLNEKAQAAKDRIQAYEHLSTEDKNQAMTQIEQTRTSAINALTSAQDFNTISEIGKDAKAAIDGKVHSAHKMDANNEILTTANAIKQKISALIDLQEGAKLTALSEVDTITIQGMNTITLLTTDSSIDLNKQYILDALDKALAEAEIASKRLEAIRQLDETRTMAAAVIEGLIGLSSDEKETMIGRINTEYNAASLAIRNGTNAVEIFAAKDAGEQAINDLVQEARNASDANIARLRSEAVSNLEAAAQAGKDAIDTMKNLSRIDKQAAKDAIEDVLTAAKAAIERANTPETIKNVETAKGAEIEAIVEAAKASDTLLKAKADAKRELETHATTAKNAIDDLETLSTADKQAAKDAIDTALSAGKTAIDQALTAEAITTAKIDKVTVIDAILEAAKASDTLLKAKTDAKLALEAHATTAKNAIDALETLSTADKQAAKDAIDAALSAGKTAIDQAPTAAAITTAKTEKVNAIDAILEAAMASDTLLKAKADAKRALETHATTAKTEIDGLQNLSATDKQVAKDAIDTALSAGKTAIDQALTAEAITTAKTEKVDAIDEIVERAKEQEAILAEEKAAKAVLDAEINRAKETLDQAANRAKDVINALETLSETEKEAAKAAVDTQRDRTKAALDEAQTIDSVHVNKEDGINAIDTIVETAKASDALLKAKEDAKQGLEANATTAKNAIDALESLSASDKQATKDAIDAALSTGKTAIDQASTAEAITTAKTEKVKVIDAIVEDAKKQNALLAEAEAKAALDAEMTRAKDAIDLATNRANEAIDALENLSESEKQVAKDKVEETRLNGHKAIDEGQRTEHSIQNTKKYAVDTIQSILDSTRDENDVKGLKNQFIADIQQKAQEAREKIDTLGGLSDAEKSTFKNRISIEFEKEVMDINAGVLSPGVQRGLTIEAIVLEAIALNSRNGQISEPQNPSTPTLLASPNVDGNPVINTNTSASDQVVEVVPNAPVSEVKEAAKNPQEPNKVDSKDSTTDNNSMIQALMQNVFIWITIAALSIGFIALIVKKRRDEGEDV